MQTKDNLRITLAEVDLAWENSGENRLNFQGLIYQLTGKSDLVILPETFTTGFTMHAHELAEPMDGPTVKWMLHLSETTGVAIGGSLLIRDNDLYYNRFVFVTPEGGISYYNKRHLFSIGGESTAFTAGDQRLVINYLGWRIAFYVCYDLRFPVWCRNKNDTDLMIFSANWPAARREVWNTLLKARAIENQVYVAGVNRIGKDGSDILYLGESQLINPRGEIMDKTFSTSGELLLYEISKSDLDDFRVKFPVSNDADRFLII